MARARFSPATSAGLPGGLCRRRRGVVAWLVERAVADGEDAPVRRLEVLLGVDAVGALVFVDVDVVNGLAAGDTAGPDQFVVAQFVVVADVDDILVDLADELAAHDVDVAVQEALPDGALEFRIAVRHDLVQPFDEVNFDRGPVFVPVFGNLAGRLDTGGRHRRRRPERVALGRVAGRVGDGVVDAERVVEALERVGVPLSPSIPKKAVREPMATRR